MERSSSVSITPQTKFALLHLVGGETSIVIYHGRYIIFRHCAHVYINKADGRIQCKLTTQTRAMSNKPSRHLFGPTARGVCEDEMEEQFRRKAQVYDTLASLAVLVSRFVESSSRTTDLDS